MAYEVAKVHEHHQRLQSAQHKNTIQGCAAGIGAINRRLVVRPGLHQLQPVAEKSAGSKTIRIDSIKLEDGLLHRLSS